jgi:hypothetical protein
MKQHPPKRRGEKKRKEKRITLQFAKIHTRREKKKEHPKLRHTKHGIQTSAQNQVRKKQSQTYKHPR